MDTINQAEIKEKNERITQPNEKGSQNQAMLQKFHQGDKHLNSTTVKNTQDHS